MYSPPIKRIFLFLILPSILFGLTGCRQGTTTSDPTAIPFTTLSEATGAYASYADAGAKLLIIQDHAAWEEVWSMQVHGNVVDDAPVPIIDFEHVVLVIAFAGQKSSGGYSIAITGVTQMNDELFVYAANSSPTPGVITTQALTSPVHAVTVPVSTHINNAQLILNNGDSIGAEVK